MAASLVHIRVDAKVKAKAQKALAAMGLSVSDAVRILLIRVATEKAMPFEIRVPNRESVAAMEDSRAGRVEDVTIDDLRAAFNEKA
jgi:DNA-damage-inducible protein J